MRPGKRCEVAARRRMASEEEIAHSVLWLCAEGAGYVTGAPIAVDGGFLAA